MENDTGHVKSILVADDDPVVRTLLSELLQSQGHLVRLASNGQECLTLLASAHPDLLFLDLQMPLLSGLDVLAELQKQLGRPPFPVVLLSADSESTKLLAARGLSADLFLLKPFKVQAISDAIARLCGSRR